jgi:hypothetical protein
MTANDQLLTRADLAIKLSERGHDLRFRSLVRDLAAALRATETQRDAAQAVIRRLVLTRTNVTWLFPEVSDPAWRDPTHGTVEPMTPAEVEAIAHATRTQP